MKFIDLFCGIGGFRYGLEKASSQIQQGEQEEQEWQDRDNLSRGGDSGFAEGTHRQPEEFHCVWSNDNDKHACQIYRKHWGEVCEQDIRTVDASAIPEHDLLCAGFPCQSFSIAGKRRGFEDTRGTLFFEICRVLRAKRPSYLLLENVKGLLSHDDGVTFQTIIRTLDELGYGYQWQVLNSKDFGVPQNRERVFIIGHFRGQPRPKVFPIGEADEVYPESDEQIAHAIDGNYHKGWLDNQQRTMIIQAGHRTSGKPRLYEDEIPSMTQDYGTGGQNIPLVMPVLTPNRERRRQQGRRMKENGEPMFALTGQDIHGIQVANAVDVNGYLRFGQRPRGENGKPQLLPIGYRRIRRLTPLECERLQGFPDGWTEGISDTQRYKCLGNAVTVNVIEAIGRQLNDSL